MGQYDPNKKYTWQQDDTFQLNGREFGTILNALRAILSTEQAAQIMLAQHANAAIEAILARGVEQDIIKESVEEPSSKNS